MPAFFHPEDIIARLPIKETDTVADFGCGPGNWVLPLSPLLKEGKIYAIDVQPEPLEVLRTRAQRKGIRNIEIVRADLERPFGSSLPTGSLDWVFLINTLFQIENKKPVLEEAWRVLKAGGRLLVIDWKENTKLGPEEGRISKDNLRVMAEEIGFKPIESFEPDQAHYALIFEKPS